jgi:hypothetical protein
MDDSFVFQGARDPRHVDPRALKFGIAAFVFVLVTGFFVRWAIVSERTSLRRLDSANAVLARLVTLPDQQLTVAEASQTAAVPATLAPSAAALQAQHEAFAALRAAKALHHRTGTFTAAGPAALTAVETGPVFVDGPSLEPAVVSISASKTAWAAAVMSSEGICYYVKLAPTDAVRYGTGGSCTGADAMSANASAW